jgi:plastocyanin
LADDEAPGRPRGRSGVLVPVALAALAAGAACDGKGGGETIPLDSTVVEIDGAVHEIRIAGVGATDSIAPPMDTVAPGDAVTFIVTDRRPHALTFVAGELDPAVRAFLEQTVQLQGPPLVNEGSTWVVLLEGAPPGRYPFVCRVHDARGVLIVAPAE